MGEPKAWTGSVNASPSLLWKNDPPELPLEKRRNPAGQTIAAKAVTQQLREVSGQLFHFFKKQAGGVSNVFVGNIFPQKITGDFKFFFLPSLIIRAFLPVHLISAGHFFIVGQTTGFLIGAQVLWITPHASAIAGRVCAVISYSSAVSAAKNRSQFARGESSAFCAFCTSSTCISNESG
jgi:hypothetical protein